MRFPCFSLLAALLLGVVFGAGCHSRAPATTPWKLDLSTLPHDPVIMSDTEFQLQVLDLGGKPLDGATATLDLVMATMDMGPNRVSLASEGQGKYVGHGQFTMAGDWNCQLTLTLNGRTQTQTFYFKVG